MKWDFFRAGGKGGQNQNKRSTGVRCTHLPSRAVGEARDGRTQATNRKAAFRRCVETQRFQGWLRLESSRKLGQRLMVEMHVEEQMKPWNIRMEVKDNGKWIAVETISEDVVDGGLGLFLAVCFGALLIAGVLT